MHKRIFLVYGTLKQRHGNHGFIAQDPNHQYLGEFTTNPEYTMFDGGFPVVERGGETSITGELYEVSDPEAIEDVFGLEGCSSQKQHDPNNWYDFDLIDTPQGQAVMFVMNQGSSRRQTIVKSGIWR